MNQFQNLGQVFVFCKLKLGQGFTFFKPKLGQYVKINRGLLQLILDLVFGYFLFVIVVLEEEGTANGGVVWCWGR